MEKNQYNENISFVLPNDLVFFKSVNEEGDLEARISTILPTTKESRFQSQLTSSIYLTEYIPENEKGSKDLLERLAKRLPHAKYLVLSDAPKAMAVNWNMEYDVFGSVVKKFATVVLVQVDDWTVLELVSIQVDEALVERKLDLYHFILDIAKSIRVKGKELKLHKATPESLKSALALTFKEQGNKVPFKLDYDHIYPGHYKKLNNEGDLWRAMYEHCFTQNPQITYKGKRFVFSGCNLEGIDVRDDALKRAFQEAGGQERSSISGVTDYLVVDPTYAGASKIRDVRKKREEGKFIEVIRFEDFVAGLGLHKTEKGWKYKD